VLSWTLCLHVFGNPEIPRNYAILKKIGRLPELKSHEIKELPVGDDHDPKALYRRFIGLNEEQLARFNARVRRDYITNFKSPLAVIYAEGDYRIEQSRKLHQSDFIPTGFALRARAVVKPDEFTKAADYPVMIEYVFPTADMAAETMFKPGDMLTIGKMQNAGVILNAARVQLDGEPVVWLTVVPISYGSYHPDAKNTFEVSVPAVVSPAAAFPLFKP
jgi:hypothetical protein